MKNRKNLHDYALGLIILGAFNLLVLGINLTGALISNSIFGAFADMGTFVITLVTVTAVVVVGIMVLVALADVLIGIKGLCVCKKPTAGRGYIIAAKVFFAVSVISAVFAFASLFDGSASLAGNILNFANEVLSAVIYVFFIKSAYALRKDVLGREK